MQLRNLTRRQYLKISALVLLIVTGAFSLYVLSHEQRHGILRVAFLDIGQGDSIFIDSPDGTQVLIDGGPGRSVLPKLAELMPFYDRSIDMIIETHPDHDHSGGLSSVIENYKVNTLMRTTGSESDPDSAKLLKVAGSHNVTVLTAKRGQVLDLGLGVTLKILFPDRYLDDKVDPNKKAIVAMLSYDNNHVLLMSDAPKVIEHYLMQLDGTDLQADILKNGHHGSKTSSAKDFLELVKPRVAILSLGKNNRYHHPSPITIDTLDNLKIPYLRTDEQGTIEFDSDGREFTRVR